jgi:hypothetical protein
MTNRTITTALGASALALALATSPAHAQQQDEGFDAADAAIAIGATAGAGVVMTKAGDMGLNGNTVRTATPGGGLRIANTLDELQRRGETAQRAHTGRIGGGANLGMLEQRGMQAQDARGRGVGHIANPELETRGNMARNARLDARNVSRVAADAPGFERQLARQVGPDGISRLAAQGDAAQAARGRIVNEGQLMRQIDKTDDIARLNRAGRAAQTARGASSARAASKIARTGRVAATAGKAGRAAVAGTGVGLAVVAAEVAVSEGVEALTGAEIQDPVTTGFQYGAAIFDKDVTLADVAAQRMEHHRENFRRIGETFTEPGRFKENLSEYGAKKAEQFERFADNVDRTDRKVRDGIESATGIRLDRRSDTMRRYGEALKGDHKVKAVGKVAVDRAQHHVRNAGKVTGKVACGIGNIFRSEKNDKNCK